MVNLIIISILSLLMCGVIADILKYRELTEARQALQENAQLESDYKSCMILLNPKKVYFARDTSEK